MVSPTKMVASDGAGTPLTETEPTALMEPKAWGACVCFVELGNLAAVSVAHGISRAKAAAHINPEFNRGEYVERLCGMAKFCWLGAASACAVLKM
jgi:hypothetical protein